jgi:alkanesulfonate monooxygenase SsuD/methylene tetrahydromethanopterin reductase-like flavin-dependent oxidoreductase (luciferase family)
MYDIPGDLLDGLRASEAVYRRLLEDVTQEQAQAARGGDEGWSIVEVMCHLRDAEERAVERARKMVTEDNPFLGGYDQEKWAKERRYAQQDLSRALEDFLRHKREHIALLEALPAEAWRRPGRHEERGGIDIQSHTLHMLAHDTQHAAQIARQLGGGR